MRALSFKKSDIVMNLFCWFAFSRKWFVTLENSPYSFSAIILRTRAVFKGKAWSEYKKQRVRVGEIRKPTVSQSVGFQKSWSFSDAIFLLNWKQEKSLNIASHSFFCISLFLQKEAGVNQRKEELQSHVSLL